MKRFGCFDLVLLGFVAAVGFFLYQGNQPLMDSRAYGPEGAQSMLANFYKQCAYLTQMAEVGKTPSLSDLQPGNYYEWQIVDLESRSQLDTDQDCNEAHLLAVATKYEDYWGKLTYGLNFQNGQQSCITREGEKRDDWSCE